MLWQRRTDTLIPLTDLEFGRALLRLTYHLHWSNLFSEHWPCMPILPRIVNAAKRGHTLTASRISFLLVTIPCWCRTTTLTGSAVSVAYGHARRRVGKPAALLRHKLISDSSRSMAGAVGPFQAENLASPTTLCNRHRLRHSKWSFGYLNEIIWPCSRRQGDRHLQS